MPRGKPKKPQPTGSQKLSDSATVPSKTTQAENDKKHPEKSGTDCFETENVKKDITSCCTNTKYLQYETGQQVDYIQATRDLKDQKSQSFKGRDVELFKSVGKPAGEIMTKPQFMDSQELSDSVTVPSEKSTFIGNDKKCPGECDADGLEIENAKQDFTTCCVNTNKLQHETSQQKDHVQTVRDSNDQKFQGFKKQEGQLFKSVGQLPEEKNSNKSQLTDSQKLSDSVAVPSGKTALLENDKKYPEKCEADGLEIENVKKDFTSSYVNTSNLQDETSQDNHIQDAGDRKDQKSQDFAGQGNELFSDVDQLAESSSDDEFPDEFFVIGNVDENIGCILSEDDWEPIDPDEYDKSSESLDRQKKGATNFETEIQKPDHSIGGDKSLSTSPNDQQVNMTVLAQMKDSTSGSLSAECQDTSSRCPDDNLTNSDQREDWEINDVVGHDRNPVSPPRGEGKSNAPRVENRPSKLDTFPKEFQDTANGQFDNNAINQAQMQTDQKLDVEAEESVDDERLATSTSNFGDDTTNLAKTWKLDSLPCEDVKVQSLDTPVECFVKKTINLVEMTIGQLDSSCEENPNVDCPNSQTAGTDKDPNHDQIKDQNLDDSNLKEDDCSNKNEGVQGDDEFLDDPDSNNGNRNHSPSSSSYLSMSSLEDDENEDEFPDDFILICDPDTKVKSIIPTKDLNDEDIVNYVDITDTNMADDGRADNLDDDITDGSDHENDVHLEDNQETVANNCNQPGTAVWVSVKNHVLATLIFGGTFVLPCLIAAKFLSRK